MTPDQTLPPTPEQASYWKQLSIKAKFFWGSLFYLTYAPYAYRYSWLRDRVEREFAPPPASEIIDKPGKLLKAEQTTNGAHFYFEQAELEVYFLTADLVRLTWQPGLLPLPYALVKREASQPVSEIAISLEETVEGWEIASLNLRLMVGIEGAIKFLDANGNLLREELPPRREGEAWSHQVKLQPKEQIYGLGERAAPLNLRKSENPAYRMWNYDAAGMYGPGSDPMYISIPLYIGLHHQGSYLVFYENTFEAGFEFKETAHISFTGGALRYYVTAGSPAQLLERYTELTGRSPLPARWALGYHQSRWGYRTEEAVRETAQQFRDLDLPLSAIHMDIDVQVGYRAFTIDPKRFPQFGTFIKELASQGVQFVTIINPGIKYSRKSKLFIEGQMLDLFCKYPNGELVIAPVWCGMTVFPDYTNPIARRWWSRQYEFMLDLGVAGFWHDMNEPAAFIAWGDRSLPKVTQHHMEGRGGDHREAHNVYGLLQAEAGYESLSQYRPHQRPFIVSRAGWAGLQRYAWTWTGDVECTWEAMRQTIATILGLGLSGIPYSGSDIGGFQGNPSAELYLRWFQMATFTPFYRSHCSNNVEYRAPWSYGEPYLGILRQFLQLRYRLMPYFYTLAWEANQKGYPFNRPLFWYHADQPELWGIDDCFYVGAALLVCPVLEEGARSRQVILPKGHWYSFWDDRTFAGGGHQLEATLETLPLFVKAGSILPMAANMMGNNAFELHLYPPDPTDGTNTTEGYVYSDVGDGDGDSRIDRFRMVRFPDGIELFWQQEGNYPFTYQGIKICLHGFKVQQAWMDGAEVSASHLMQEGNTACYETDAIFQQAFFKGEF